MFLQVARKEGANSLALVLAVGKKVAGKVDSTVGIGSYCYCYCSTTVRVFSTLWAKKSLHLLLRFQKLVRKRARLFEFLVLLSVHSIAHKQSFSNCKSHFLAATRTANFLECCALRMIQMNHYFDLKESEIDFVAFDRPYY